MRNLVPRFVTDLIHELYNEGFDGQLVPKRKKKNGVAEAKALAEKARKKANAKLKREQGQSEKRSGKGPRSLKKLSTVRPEILMTPVKRRKSLLGAKPTKDRGGGSR